MTLFRRGGRRDHRTHGVLALVAVAALVAVGAAAAVTTRSAVAPSNSSVPTIGGNATAGNTLTANPGTWSGSAPIGFQYQWRICDGNGAACHDIAGATTASYVLKADDAGNTLVVRVIASNSDGSSNATSVPTARVAAATAGPVNTTPPTITGTATTGGTLTATAGAWSGPAPITFTYQWLICDGKGDACHDISGATAQTYKLVTADQGNTARVRVSAKNAGGTSTSTSVATATIAAGGTPPTSGCAALPAGTQSVPVAGVTSPARLQIAGFQLVSGKLNASMSSFSVRFHVTDTCNHSVSGALLYVTAVPYNMVSIPTEATTDATGWVTLTFNRLRGYPATPSQQLMVMFARARKPGDPLLAGISTRRLVSLPVNLKG